MQLIEEATEKAGRKKNLSRRETKQLFDEIMSGKIETGLLAAFLKALAEKGETAGEIAGAAESMRAAAATVKPNVKGNLLDIVGTGGDKKNAINASTAAAIVAASAGCLVAKHGNRGISSKSGSADVLEKLGVKIDLNPEQNARLIEKIGIAFLFAPCHHPAMKHAMPARKILGIRTIFNILGPLTNPSNAQTMLLGCFDQGLAEKIAAALARLRIKHALVVHGLDGFDEISLCSNTRVFEVKGKKINPFEVSPEQFGFARAKEEQLKVETTEQAALEIKAIFENKMHGPKKDFISLNAGAGIYVNGKARTIKEGIEKAAKAIEEGKAMQKLCQLAKESNSMQ